MRVLLRTLAPLLGLALALVGALLVLEVVAAWVRPGSTGVLLPWADWQADLRALSWSDGPVRVAAVCVAVLGLLLLLVALLARRHDVALTSPTPAMTVSTTPRVLARLVGRTVRESEEVAAATVSASARRVVVRAEGWPDTEGGLKETVRARTDALFDDLPLARRPSVAVTTRSRREPR